LRILEIENFDLILLDLALPGQSGLELLPLIKERQPETPVIMITAYGTCRQRRRSHSRRRGELRPEALGQRKAHGRHSLGRGPPSR
jgi:CheY-like chemotaxis protein